MSGTITVCVFSTGFALINCCLKLIVHVISIGIDRQTFPHFAEFPLFLAYFFKSGACINTFGVSIHKFTALIRFCTFKILAGFITKAILITGLATLYTGANACRFIAC